jgi:hypothetical protein
LFKCKGSIVEVKRGTSSAETHFSGLGMWGSVQEAPAMSSIATT